MQDLYYYINHLYSTINQQNKKLQGLEGAIQELRNEIDSLKNKPSINVERLEYKFDQLKVETLEGTLNIGLNPSDIDKIEDFAVDQQTSAANSQTPMPQQLPEGLREKVSQSSSEYIDRELSTLILDTEDQLQIRIDPQYHTLIIEDIKRQLPQRISYYINTLSSQYRSEDDSSLDEIIFSRIKADIQQAVYTFIAQLPDELKGKNNNGT